MVTTTNNRTSAFFDWLIMVALFTLFLAAAFTSRWQHSLSSEIDWSLWWDGFLQNSGTEMLGAFLTFGLIEILRGRRKESEAEEAEEDRKQEIQDFMDRVSQRTENQVSSFLDKQQAIITTHVDQALVAYQKTLDEQEKRALINQLLSTVPGFAAEAVRLLRHKGWLEVKDIAEALRAGGDFHLADLREVVLVGEELRAPKLSQANLERADLEGARLPSANLEGAFLRRANLRRINLEGANLKDVELEGAEMEGAELWEANLEGANLGLVNLGGADLEGANLERANLGGANLKGIFLWEANLKGARQVTIKRLTQAKSLEGATLPDGTKLPGRAPGEIPTKKTDSAWREAFEEWCKTIPVDKYGFIIVPEEDD